MKNVFKQIKQYISDHRACFISCAFYLAIVGVIIGIVCAIYVPSSAEASSTTIESGTYRFNDELTPFGSINESYITLNFTCPNVSSEGYEFGNYLGFSFIYDSSTGALLIGYGTPYDLYLPIYTDSSRWNSATELSESFPNGYGQTITVISNTEFTDDYGKSFVTWFEANTEPVTPTPSQSTITAGTYFGVDVPSTGSYNVSFSYTSNGYDFDTFYVGSDSISYRALSGNDLNVTAFDFSSDLWMINYESITVPTDQTLPVDFVTWFNSNYTTQITPDPEPTYTIEAGYYKARDSFTTSGWNVSNDSIRIRYYNDAANVQAYEVVDGISFLVENDAAEIYYSDASVFTDGWNIAGAKNIQVMQDVTVGSDFYTVFNNVYAPSSEGTNEYDSGYAAGYQDGRDEGYDIGYRQGYAEGLADGDTNIFTDIIGGTLAAVDSFTIFGGFSLLDLISTLLGGMALVWILKLLAGG